MAYDNPLRVTYTLTGDADASVTRNVAIPAGVARARIRHVGQSTEAFTSADSATLPLEVGVVGELGKFYDREVTVTTAAPAATDKKQALGFEVEDEDFLVLTRGADGSGPSKSVTTTVVIDWY